MAGSQQARRGERGRDPARAAGRAGRRGRGTLRASAARPPVERGPDVRRRLRALPRVHQADGAALRRELSDDQEPPESHRRPAAVRRGRAGAGAGAPVHERAAHPPRTRRAECGGRSQPTASEGVVMSEETRRVLDLLAQGKITVDEADRLLAAIRPVSTGSAATGAAAAPGKGAATAEAASPRYLRITVTKTRSW